MRDHIVKAEQAIRAQVGDEQVTLGLSGGVVIENPASKAGKRVGLIGLVCL